MIARRLTFASVLLLVLLLPANVFAQSYPGAVLIADLFVMPWPIPYPPETYAGSTISYMIMLGSYGEDPATDVVLHEVVPEYTSYTGNWGWVCTDGGKAGATCTFTHHDMNPGHIDIELFDVTVDAQLPCDLEFIENTLSVTYSGETLAPITLPHKVIHNGECIPAPASVSCPTVPQYYMYTLEDAGQPFSWQPYCYIISSNGYPAVEIQARLCSPAGSDYSFKATNIPFGGWVYSDCRGVASYGWPFWQPEWYRPK
jgi:hypothetical protein